MKNSIWNILIILCLASSAYSQRPATKTERMQWFKDAKLGIFIHWGIYAVEGIGESWSFHNGHISHADYMKQLDGFHATAFEPEKWAELIKASGAKYTVITSKHHDGVALWDTKLHDLSTKQKTPAARDVLTPFSNAIREAGLKLGLYYSLIDWSHENYPNFLRKQKRYENDSLRWQKFTAFNHGQIKEISQQFKPDLLWFDGDWEFNAQQWQAKKIRTMLLNDNPDIIINSRLQGYGDYATPEQGLPITRPKDKYWELCYTMNDSWGYQGQDTNYKSSNQIIRVLVDCIAMGGNLLLGIGPKADGTIPEEQIQILHDIGRWTRKHAEAIYQTEAGIPHSHFYGPTSLSKDKKTLYLYIDNIPNGALAIKGINNKVKRARVVGSNKIVPTKVFSKLSWSKFPAYYISQCPKKHWIRMSPLLQ